MPYVFAANGLDDIVWRSTEKLCDDRKLVDVVLSWEQRLALEHFRKDAACTPDIDLNIVFLPCKHNLWRTVVAGGNVSSHLGVLYTGQAEVADLQIAILVDKDVARLQVTVNDTSGVNIFQTTLSRKLAEIREGGVSVAYQDLVEEVLDKLLLQRPGGEQTVKISSKQFGDKVT